MAPDLQDAQTAVEEAQSAYDAQRRGYEKLIAGPLTPHRVIEEADVVVQLRDAALRLETARADLANLKKIEADERTAEASRLLAESESEMANKAVRAEALMDELAPLLIDLAVTGKRRYGAEAEITGRAEHGLLPTPILVGWVRHRLADLESTDLGRAMRHQRGALADLLALTPSATESEEVSK